VGSAAGLEIAMNGVLFLAQNQLDAWLDEGHVDMGADVLIFTADRSEIPMVPAVRFLKAVDGADPNKLLGKVKAVEAMRMGGAEVSQGAVVLGDVGYEVEDGYMLTVPMVAPAARPATLGKLPAAKPSGKEADMLAQFILDKLS
jgi:hypothetical protein